MKTRLPHGIYFRALCQILLNYFPYFITLIKDFVGIDGSDKTFRIRPKEAIQLFIIFAAGAVDSDVGVFQLMADAHVVGDDL